MSLTQAEADLVAETTVARLRAEFGDQAPVPPSAAPAPTESSAAGGGTVDLVAPDQRHPMTSAAYDLAMARAAAAQAAEDAADEPAEEPEESQELEQPAPQEVPSLRRLGLRLLASVWDFGRLALAAFAAQLAATGTGHLDAKGLASLALGALEAGYRQYVVSRAPAASAALEKGADDPERAA